jgi:hypothetical protein
VAPSWLCPSLNFLRPVHPFESSSVPREVWQSFAALCGGFGRKSLNFHHLAHGNVLPHCHFFDTTLAAVRTLHRW